MDFFEELHAVLGRDGSYSKEKREAYRRQKNLYEQGKDLQKQNVLLKEELEAEKERAVRLENELNEMKVENEKVERNMESKRDEIDQLICGVTCQIQEMMDSLDQQMGQLEFKTDRQIRELGESSSQHIAELKGTTDQLEELQAAVQPLTEIQASVQQIEDIKKAVSKLDEIQATLATMEAHMAAVWNIGDKLEETKTELADRIHEETVKCYRNTKDLVDELEEKMGEVEIAQKSMTQIQKSFVGMKVFSFFGLIGCAATIFLVLYVMGIIQF